MGQARPSLIKLTISALLWDATWLSHHKVWYHHHQNSSLRSWTSTESIFSSSYTNSRASIFAHASKSNASRQWHVLPMKKYNWFYIDLAVIELDIIWQSEAELRCTRMQNAQNEIDSSEKECWEPIYIDCESIHCYKEYVVLRIDPVEALWHHWCR